MLTPPTPPYVRIRIRRFNAATAELHHICNSFETRPFPEFIPCVRGGSFHSPTVFMLLFEASGMIVKKNHVI